MIAFQGMTWLLLVGLMWCSGVGSRLGSGSHKNKSPLPVVAMEKEAHVQLIHQERCGEGERFAHKASPKR
jgi:hypothetical protein